MTVNDQFFYKTSCIEKKYSNINCAESWMVADVNCELQDLLLEVVDLIQEVPDLRSGGIPRPNLTHAYDTPCNASTAVLPARYVSFVAV